MEDGGGKSFDKTLPKDQMEAGTSGRFEKSLSRGEVGERKHNEKATRQGEMEEGHLEKDQKEDIEWLSTLSHSHCDLLISLKELAILRAKNAGYEEVAEKFDLRMLRELGTIVMERLKEGIQNASIFPCSSEGFELLSGNQFAAPNHENSCTKKVVENIKSSSRPTRKRLLEGSRMGLQSSKRLKIEDSNRHAGIG